MEINEDVAELVGIILGDGNIYVDKSKGHYQLRITGDLIKDKEYHEYISHLFFKIFNKKIKTKIYPDRRVLYFYSKEIINTLLYFGLVSGSKLGDNVCVPEWIFSKKEYVISCLRGLMDTDGTVFPKSTNKNFLQIEISSAIPNLRISISKMFLSLGIKVSNWSKGGNTPNCGIYAKEEIFKYCKFVNFNNPCKRRKFDALVVQPGLARDF